ncbi:glyoxalase-like protein [Actinoalloteichus sp. AHMU CJ021]|uniref:Glyoxalase-like domain-containing protein n=2 Tax=Pseudonocardiaceae TaxID=2070 RepID=A0ABT1JLI6_ACTCY|nr:VOC family protein [Actinoalloteichus caeruleus]AUS81724.1 glyoxalase-like protein [Actinoalloteichus sp. AHMU CJ021]MCP2333383.1 Glyoxalase-like domain-containing protein [Actinoalloteichus caeruleus DSM 43889]
MVTARRIAPILPVRDLLAAMEHYRTLGFEVAAHDDASYAFAQRDEVEIHLTPVVGHDPATSAGAAYLYVDDAAALAAAWEASSSLGTTRPPVATDHGLLEGAHVDPDGNLIRFGSPLPPPG